MPGLVRTFGERSDHLRRSAACLGIKVDGPAGNLAWAVQDVGPALLGIAVMAAIIWLASHQFDIGIGLSLRFSASSSPQDSH
jgi:hypothetical protein